MSTVKGSLTNLTLKRNSHGIGFSLVLQEAAYVVEHGERSRTHPPQAQAQPEYRIKTSLSPQHLKYFNKSPINPKPLGFKLPTYSGLCGPS